MSMFLEIVGWIVFLAVSFFSTLIGLVARGRTAEETGKVVYWLLFFVVAIGSKILWIENIWLATGIWLVGGFILGNITAPLLIMNKRLSRKKRNRKPRPTSQPKITLVYRMRKSKFDHFVDSYIGSFSTGAIIGAISSIVFYLLELLKNNAFWVLRIVRIIGLIIIGIVTLILLLTILSIILDTSSSKKDKRFAILSTIGYFAGALIVFFLVLPDFVV